MQPLQMQMASSLSISLLSPSSPSSPPCSDNAVLPSQASPLSAGTFPSPPVTDFSAIVFFVLKHSSDVGVRVIDADQVLCSTSQRSQILEQHYIGPKKPTSLFISSFLLTLFTTITVNEPALGLKTIFNFRVPDQRWKFRTDVLAIGSKLSYDIKIGEFTKYNAGVNFTKADLVASLTV
ncbi:Mitochondrial outer membrane protein porin of 34 kDa [Arachis hypogaea]|nr:Mitochondrial outer membrane protein porin of 34 kDa [Arachis hypogaea]